MTRALPLRAIILSVLALGGRAWASETEIFGNAPFNEANYRQWPGILPVVNHPSRIYQAWVNGNELCYYRGTIWELNDLLQKFAASGAKVHEVLLRPAPGIAKSFAGDTTISYNWSLHLLGGIVASVMNEDQRSKIWGEYPTLTVYVGGDIALKTFEVPNEIALLESDDFPAGFEREKRNQV